VNDSTRPSRPRRSGFLALGLPGLVALSACATNPLSGKSNLALIPEEQEIEIGKSAAVEIAATMGLYDNPELTAYVERIGKAFAAKSERPHLPWQFQVIDDPMVNAFAVGGGAVFVTRGLLAHLSSEAQLATVVGHEIGHVTGRHTVRQLSKTLVLIAGAELGQALWKGWSDVEGLVNPALNLLMLRYSRDDEREADDLGYRYAIDNGYEIREAPGVFMMFKKVAEAAGADDSLVWLSSHPESGARADHFAKRIADTRPPLGMTGKEEFLAVTNHLVYGPDPRQGFFEGGVFKHPRRKFQITPPPSWHAGIAERALIATPPNDPGGIKIGETTETSTPAEALDSFMSREGITKGDAFTVAMSTPHVGARFTRQDDEGNDEAGAILFFSHAGTIMKAAFVTKPEKLAAIEAGFRASLATFATLTDAAALAVEPARLKVVTVPRTMTLSEFAKQHPAVAVEHLAMMNHLEPEFLLAAGLTIKVVEGRVRDDQLKPGS
jgi:predicted Zn-dependent protease